MDYRSPSTGLCRHLRKLRRRPRLSGRGTRAPQRKRRLGDGHRCGLGPGDRRCLRLRPDGATCEPSPAFGPRCRWGCLQPRHRHRRRGEPRTRARWLRLRELLRWQCLPRHARQGAGACEQGLPGRGGSVGLQRGQCPLLRASRWRRDRLCGAVGARRRWGWSRGAAPVPAVPRRRGGPGTARRHRVPCCLRAQEPS